MRKNLTTISVVAIAVVAGARTVLLGQSNTADAEHWPDEQLVRWAHHAFVRLKEWLLSASPTDWLLVLIGAAGTWVALRTLNVIHEELGHTAKLANAAKANADASLMAQRPYVDISHRPPGLTIDSAHVQVGSVGEPRHHATIELEIKNHGKTPADVVSWVISVQAMSSAAPIPENPPYPPVPAQGETILMAGQSLFTPHETWIPDSDYQQVQNGSLTVYVFGCVEYRDRFGKMHRSGYARHYDPHTNGNNLLYVTARGYNYDVEIDAHAT